MTNPETQLKLALTELEKAESQHFDTDIKNKNRLSNLSATNHNIAIANVLTSLIKAFPKNKIVAIIEAEILQIGYYSNPEDIVLWVEGIGLFVIEIKSHTIKGIRSFENNIPQIVYKGSIVSDTHIIDQPKDFAYKLRADIEPLLEDKPEIMPAIYYAAWLPNISVLDVQDMGGNIDHSKVWLSDMLDKDVFINRIQKCRNLTRGNGAPRESADVILERCFGCSAGLRTKKKAPSRSTSPGSLAYQIAERNNSLKRLTNEQVDIIENKHLLTGPKVIRGVAGSGKTIVLANVVADLLVNMSESRLFETQQKILVLCYNTALVILLKQLIFECFQRRKRDSGTSFPTNLIDVVNINRLAWDTAQKRGIPAERGDSPAQYASDLVKNNAMKGHYDYIFLDEGQDIDLDWFQWIRFIASNHKPSGPSIVIFYDDAQNLYGCKRPGTGNVMPWKEYLGGEVNSRGLRTIMRVGHRNTNEILTFSFNLLLGAYAEKDPLMTTFSDISEYKQQNIPDDSQLGHPNAGKPCIEDLGDRNYKINFALHNGPFPKVNIILDYSDFWREYIAHIKFLIDPLRGNINPHDILLMCAVKRDVESIEEIFKENKIDFRVAQKDTKSTFFQDGKITLSTIHSAKGYTAHICHLLFVENFGQPGHVGRDREQQERAKLHVACTRAMTSLELFGKECPFMDEAIKAAKNLG